MNSEAYSKNGSQPQKFMVLNEGKAIKKSVDESKYVQKKPASKESEYKLELSVKEKQIAESLKIAEDYLNKLSEEEKQELLHMKQKYPKRFCIFHRELFDNEDSYKNHVIYNDQTIAKAERFVKFQCSNCFEVFQRRGWYERPVEKCSGEKDLSEKLTPRQLKLLKISKQIQSAE